MHLPSAIAVLTLGKFVSLNLNCGDRIVLEKFNVEHTNDWGNWS